MVGCCLAADVDPTVLFQDSSSSSSADEASMGRRQASNAGRDDGWRDTVIANARITESSNAIMLRCAGGTGGGGACSVGGTCSIGRTCSTSEMRSDGGGGFGSGGIVNGGGMGGYGGMGGSMGSGGGGGSSSVGGPLGGHHQRHHSGPRKQRSKPFLASLLSSLQRMGANGGVKPGPESRSVHDNDSYVHDHTDRLMQSARPFSRRRAMDRGTRTQPPRSSAGDFEALLKRLQCGADGAYMMPIAALQHQLQLLPFPLVIVQANQETLSVMTPAQQGAAVAVPLNEAEDSGAGGESAGGSAGGTLQETVGRTAGGTAGRDLEASAGANNDTSRTDTTSTTGTTGRTHSVAASHSAAAGAGKTGAQASGATATTTTTSTDRSDGTPAGGTASGAGRVEGGGTAGGTASGAGRVEGGGTAEGRCSAGGPGETCSRAAGGSRGVDGGALGGTCSEGLCTASRAMAQPSLPPPQPPSTAAARHSSPDVPPDCAASSSSQPPSTTGRPAGPSSPPLPHHLGHPVGGSSHPPWLADVVLINDAALGMFGLQSSEDFVSLLHSQLEAYPQALAMLMDTRRLDPLSARRRPVRISPEDSDAQDYLSVEAAACHLLRTTDADGALYAPSSSAGIMISYSRRDPNTSDDTEAAPAMAGGTATCTAGPLTRRLSSRQPLSPASSVRQLLDSALMANMQMMVMAFNMSGQIVHQNQASVDYMGRVDALAPGCGLAGGDSVSSLCGFFGPEHSHLHQMLRFEPRAVLHDMFEALMMEQEWEGTVRMPPPGQVFRKDLQGLRSPPGAAEDIALTDIDEQGEDGRASTQCAVASAELKDSFADRPTGTPRRSPNAPRRSHSYTNTIMQSRAPPKRSKSTHVLQAAAAAGGLAAAASSRGWGSTGGGAGGGGGGGRCRRQSNNSGSIPARVLRFFSGELISAVCEGSSGSDESDGPDRPSAKPLWHEVTAKTMPDPRGGEGELIMLTALDVHAKIEADHQVAKILGAEHAILEQLFPRHVIEYMAAAQSRGGAANRLSALVCGDAILPTPSAARSPSHRQGRTSAVSIPGSTRSSFRLINGLTPLAPDGRPSSSRTSPSSMLDGVSGPIPSPSSRRAQLQGSRTLMHSSTAPRRSSHMASSPPGPSMPTITSDSGGPSLEDALVVAVAAADAAAAAAEVSSSSVSTAPSSLCRNLGALSTSHEQVTIMFADIVGFTSMCKVVPPATVMAFLNELYSAFDELVAIYRVYKVETAGDCYIVAGGLMTTDEDGFTSVRKDVDPLNAMTVLEFAKAMLREAGKVVNPATRQPIQMRVGLHSGPVVSGVVGTKMPRFCLFGDSMNTAQRMESASRAGAIHVSEATKRLLPNERWEPTGGIELKGLGMCSTFFWQPQEDVKLLPESSRRISAAFERRYSPAEKLSYAVRFPRLNNTLDRRYSMCNSRHTSGSSTGTLDGISERPV